MGSFKDKVQGGADIGMGRLKQGLSNDLGDDSLRGQGMTQEMGGHGRRKVGFFKDRVSGVLGRFASKIRRSG